jgi:hypothetical protein
VTLRCHRVSWEAYPFLCGPRHGRPFQPAKSSGKSIGRPSTVNVNGTWQNPQADALDACFYGMKSGKQAEAKQPEACCGNLGLLSGFFTVGIGVRCAESRTRTRCSSFFLEPEQIEFRRFAAT